MTVESIEKAAKAVAEMAIESGAGVARVVGRDDNEKPLWAIVVTIGAEETQEIIDAIEAIEAKA
jgi:hypothetical protein